MPSVNPKYFSRINVIGTSGCGKSTFSKRLAEALNIPYIEMDRVYWKPNWIEPDNQEFFSKLKDAISSEKWVLDGNYQKATAIKWENVELVIWLDYSFYRIFYQIIKRVIYRSTARIELWPGTGNKESFYRSFFTKDSIILWVLKTYGKNKQRYGELINNNPYPHIRFVRIENPEQAEKLLRIAKSRI